MDLYDFLSANDIACQRFDHCAVYTVEDVNRLIPHLPGAKVKNLFLRDNKGRRHFLVVVPDHLKVDLKALGLVLGCGRVSMASAQRLERHLGILPGAVSLLALFNDRHAHAVEPVIDQILWNAPFFQFHPLVNTSTLVIPKAGIATFLGATGHKALVIPVPGTGHELVLSNPNKPERKRR